MTRKLWDIIREDLGYSIDCTDEIVDAVEKWLPSEHLEDKSLLYKTAVNVEEIFDNHKKTGYNDCLKGLKENLR